MRVVVAIAVDGRGPLICLCLDLAKSILPMDVGSLYRQTGLELEEEAGGDRFPSFAAFQRCTHQISPLIHPPRRRECLVALIDVETFGGDF